MTALEVLEGVKQRSEEGVQRARDLATKHLGEVSGLIVGVNGSYARREATTGSDLDLFFLHEGRDPKLALEAKAALDPVLLDNGFVLPSAGGVFERPLGVDVLTDNIGGAFDNNDTITRRMLLLLEGEWLLNKSAFDSARSKILAAYVPNDVPREHICLFLLNDIIRYWRTMCVDYENKILKDKARAIRLVKLRFSRMLLYWGGVIAAAETWNLTGNEKRSQLEGLLSIPTVARLRNVFGGDSDGAIDAYAEFLSALNDVTIRNELEDKGLDLRSSETYQRLRSVAKEFRLQLVQLLRKKYPDDHPIHLALIL